MEMESIFDPRVPAFEVTRIAANWSTPKIGFLDA